MRIATKPIRAYPWYLRPFFWNQRRNYGRALDASLLWARSPRLFLGVAMLYGMIDRRGSPIEPALRSLVTVRVSQINWCAFCVDLNSATLLKRGASMEKIEALSTWRSSALFTERERAALDYAEAMTRSDAEVEDGHFERLRAHFDDDAIVELTGLIAFQSMSSKFNSALAVPPQGFCAIPVAIESAAPAEVRHVRKGGRTRRRNRTSKASTRSRMSEEGEAAFRPANGATEEDRADPAMSPLGSEAAARARDAGSRARSR